MDPGARHTSASAEGFAARFGNVSAATLGEPDPTTAALLRALFVECRTLPGDASLESWISALEAATAERVLVVADGAISLDLILALVCWPESDAVVFEAGGAPRLAILRPDAVLESARADTSRSVDSWLEAIGSDRVDWSALGMADSPVEAR